MQGPILHDAKLALEKLTADPQLREQAEWLEAEIKLYQIGTRKLREEGRAEGLVEGRAEGLVEGQVSTLVRLLTLKFGAVTPDVRARIVSAPRADLDRWTERVLTATSIEDLLEG